MCLMCVASNCKTENLQEEIWEKLDVIFGMSIEISLAIVDEIFHWCQI